MYKVLIVGCGHMGASHARAYHQREDCEIVGVVSRGPLSRGKLSDELGGIQEYDDFHGALQDTDPDLVIISTFPDTHAEYAIDAMKAGAHVFVEKPLAETVEDAERVSKTAERTERKLVVGYILRQHPSWSRFVELAGTLGKPLVMRMNLNQQSSGEDWTWHKNLMNSLSPIVDCGVHYVDIMCQMTGAKPVRVHGMGARLTDELKADMYNYGHLQVVFDDGSVGWYEAGWGPMMSEQAFFVKDVIGPKGCVSIVAGKDSGSSDIDSHTATNRLLIHSSQLDENGAFVKADETIDMADEPDHQELCNREQAYLIRAIEKDLDLTDHINDAVNSLRIVLAADVSHRTGQAIDL